MNALETLVADYRLALIGAARRAPALDCAQVGFALACVDSANPAELDGANAHAKRVALHWGSLDASDALEAAERHLFEAIDSRDIEGVREALAVMVEIWG